MKFILSLICSLLVLAACTKRQQAKQYLEKGNDRLKNDTVFNEAINDFTKAIELDPDFADAYLGRGYAKLLNQQHELALQDFKKASLIEPKFLCEYYRQSGLYETGKKNFSKAIGFFNKAISLKPDVSVLYLHRGDAEQERGAYQLALNNFNKAIQLDPKDGENYRYRGLLKLKLRDFKGANQDFKSARDLGDKPATEYYSSDDNRPDDQLYFLNRVKEDSDYEITSDAIKKDAHVAAFNRYALDSLKNIKNWEVIITDINDNEFSANSFATNVFRASDVYNVEFVAPIRFDRSVDSIAIDNRVDLKFTTLKNPRSESGKKILSTIKTLKVGDVVLVSGGLTHIDENLKPNFASFYESSQPWNVDLLLTDIRKKTN